MRLWQQQLQTLKCLVQVWLSITLIPYRCQTFKTTIFRRLVVVICIHVTFGSILSLDASNFELFTKFFPVLYFHWSSLCEWKFHNHVVQILNFKRSFLKLFIKIMFYREITMQMTQCNAGFVPVKGRQKFWGRRQFSWPYSNSEWSITLGTISYLSTWQISRNTMFMC